jgi:hypothetical protein
MSTITEGCRRGARLLCAAALTLAAWFSMAAFATLVLEPTRTVAVFAPASIAFSALTHADARLVDAGAGFILVQGGQKGFVRQLYAGGGWLVLPALTGGCRGGGKLRDGNRQS